MRQRETTVVWGCAALALIIWVFRALHWNSILDGDSALYSLMSLDVLDGRHYLHTVGQAHGGTPLVYLRAALFKVFGPSPFLGFFLNGVAVAAAVAIWARFAYRISGTTAALVFGVFGALGSSVFAQYSCTDYYVLSVIMGGLLLNHALTMATTMRLTLWSFAQTGILGGFSFYICRFTPLYMILAFGFFLALAPAVRRAMFLPTIQEVRYGRGFFGLLAKLFFLSAVVNALLFIPAFFTDDRFLGVSAEISMKLAAKSLAALWLVLRGRVLVESPIRTLAVAGGFLLGDSPDLIFKLLHPTFPDRNTGLVRWSDLAPLVPELGTRLGKNFSRTDPDTLGLLAATAVAVVLGLGLAVNEMPRNNGRRWLVVALLGAAPAFFAWLLIHTYMYLMVQYFYPLYFPLYLALGLAVAATRAKKIALLFLLPIAAAATGDLARDVSQPNARLESGVFETLREWDVRVGTGDFWSTYDMMWASKREFILDPLSQSKFPYFHERILAEKRLAYVFRAGDNVPLEKQGYNVLKSVELKHGYRVELLEKKP